jgi:outer membrane lipoprotein-sorting protein
MSDPTRPPAPEFGRDPLERATDALRSFPTGEGPPPAILAATVAALTMTRARDIDPAPDVIPLRRRSQTRRKLMFRLLNAAAALVLVTATVWLVPLGVSRASFRDVQNECRKAKNVQYTMVQKLSRTSPEITSRLTVDDHHIRVDYGDAVSIILDLDARKGVQIVRSTKSYRPEVGNEKASAALSNLVEQLIALPAADAEQAGTEMVDGKKTNVFRLKKFRFIMDNTRSTKDDGLLTVWADPTTKLPVKVEVRMFQEAVKEWSVFTMKDFSWSVEIPAGFFDLNPPEGYTELPPIDPRTGMPLKPAK